MAKVLEEYLIIRLSTLLPDESTQLTVLTPEMKSQIIAFTQQTVGNSTIVEIPAVP
jgi:hypothetical protein